MTELEYSLNMLFLQASIVQSTLECTASFSVIYTSDLIQLTHLPIQPLLNFFPFTALLIWAQIKFHLVNRSHDAFFSSLCLVSLPLYSGIISVYTQSKNHSGILLSTDANPQISVSTFLSSSELDSKLIERKCQFLLYFQHAQQHRACQKIKYEYLFDKSQFPTSSTISP